MTKALSQYITRHQKVPFSYGQMDCVLFAFGWAELKTGVDKLADLPKWCSEKEARRVIRSVGGLENGLDARFTRIDARQAKDGDLAIFNGSVCIFSGAHIVGPSEDGLIYVDRMKAQCAWSV